MLDQSLAASKTAAAGVDTTSAVVAGASATELARHVSPPVVAEAIERRRSLERDVESQEKRASDRGSSVEQSEKKKKRKEKKEKKDKKEKKRKEAEVRSMLHTKQAPVRKELQRIEKELETREARKREIEAIMADPASYENRSVIVPLLEEEPILTKKIRELEAKWEALSGQLEEIQRATVVA